MTEDAEPEPVVITGRDLTLEEVVRVARQGAPVEVSDDARTRLRTGRAIVERILDRPEDADPVYGVTTGFGELARVRIPPEDVEELQVNLVRSHACGQGERLPADVVRGILLLQANGLSTGESGVRPAVVDHLVTLLNHDVLPVVPRVGSLGASGDLVPLAHAALVLLGEGEATVEDRTVPGAEALETAGLEPLAFQAKEGIALINGTQVLQALLALAVHDARTLVRTAEVAAAMGIEALLASVAPLDSRLHDARPHPGQRASAANLRALTEGSPLVASHEDCDRVQDAYSLRCTPQVLGAARTALDHVAAVVEVELNSATDNPLLFPPDLAVSGGNFHGEPLALAAGYLTQALAEVGALSERRTNRLLDPDLNEGLPAFLSPRPGLHSGLMLPHYVAAALAMEDKALAWPAAADSLPVSGNQEDHVSNGLQACWNLHRVAENVTGILAVELLTAAQALDEREDRRGVAPGEPSRAARAAVREVAARVERDRSLKDELDLLGERVQRGGIVEAVEVVTGPLA